MKFKKGDLVRRDYSTRMHVVQGGTYTVENVSENGSFIQIDGEWYEAWKFSRVGPYDH